MQNSKLLCEPLNLIQNESIPKVSVQSVAILLHTLDFPGSNISHMKGYADFQSLAQSPHHFLLPRLRMMQVMTPRHIRLHSMHRDKLDLREQIVTLFLNMCHMNCHQNVHTELQITLRSMLYPGHKLNETCVLLRASRESVWPTELPVRCVGY